MSIRRDDIARLSGGSEYAQYLLRARREFERGHAATSRQIQDVYRRAAAGIRDDIAALTPGTLRHAHLSALQAKLDGRAAQMSKDVLAATHHGIWMASGAGSKGVQQVTQHMLGDAFPEPALARLFAGINERATLAMLARTRRDGLKISDRVWRTSENARNNIRRIVEDAVVRGQDARKTARLVQQYLQPGVWKALKLETRRRLGVGTDVSYQAMRLARTEMNNAFHEGMVAANQHSPGYRGIYWRLSPQHPAPDVCDDMATDMSHGEPGFYPKGFEPVRPHPQCFCITISSWENPEQFAERLRSWQQNPRLQPDIERWYNEDARRFIGRTIIITAPTALETAFQKAEAQIAGLQHERAYLFDKKGKEVLVKDGSRNQVSFTASERAMMKDNILTHNHPTTGGSFSWDDIWFAAQEDMAEIRAVGQKYVHRMIRPEAGWPEVRVIRDAYQVADNEVYRMFIPKVNAGIMTTTEAGEKHFHEVWLRAARKTGLNYIREAR
jgi:hypothetical protein